MVTIRTFFMMVVSFVISGCSIPEAVNVPSTNETETNYAVIQPVDDFPGIITGMRSTTQGIVLDDPEICLLVNADAFWKPGDFWDEDEDAPQLDMIVDGANVTLIEVSAIGPTFIIPGEEGGEILGSYPMRFDYCTTLNLDSGKHTMTIRIRKSVDQTLQYSWNFFVL